MAHLVPTLPSETVWLARRRKERAYPELVGQVGWSDLLATVGRSQIAF